MFTPIGSVLKSLSRRSKIPDAILALHIRKVFGDALHKICGDLNAALLKDVKPTTFKKGTLTVSTSGLMAAELQMRAGGLLREINEVLGKKVVVKIRFRSF